MAQLNTRGTLTRGRWDYFEHSNGWVSVYGSVVSGGIGCYFANNSTATMQLDIYNLTWYASVSAPWNVQILPPPLVLTALAPTDIQVHAMQPDRGQLAGVAGMFTAYGGPFYIFQRVSNGGTSGIVAPVAGGPFVTLPPQWAISVAGNVGTNPCELSMNVWYQEVIDNVAPAP